jgi:hypothetical protein
LFVPVFLPSPSRSDLRDSVFVIDVMQ